MDARFAPWGALNIAQLMEASEGLSLGVEDEMRRTFTLGHWRFRRRLAACSPMLLSTALQHRCTAVESLACIHLMARLKAHSKWMYH